MPCENLTQVADLLALLAQQADSPGVFLEGEQLCLDLKPTELSKTHSFHCLANGTKQEDSWCKKDVAGCKELVTPILKVSINEAEAKESADELSLGQWTVDGETIAAMAL